MLADRSVLVATLAVAFASGGAAGWMSRGGGAVETRPYAVETVFRDEIRALGEQGWDPADVDRATEAYSDYLTEYTKWWDAFVDSHRDALDDVDARLAARLERIDAERGDSGEAPK